MADKGFDYDQYAKGLFLRTEQYADKVRRHYATAVEELLNISVAERLKKSLKGDLGIYEAFSFSDSRRLSDKANSVLRMLYSAVYNEIKSGVCAEWENANLYCDALIKAVFGKRLKEDDHFARWFGRNEKAVDAFFKRKTAYGGLNLSQRVWKYVSNLKTEMEVALTVSIGQGDSAAIMSRRVRKYLQNPDDMFRRFRVKVGEENILDEKGEIIGTKPVYGKKWKRKNIDPQTGEVTWENFNPKNYHTGRGIYRSSYKNAMRLTRSETNMAYRTAEQDRWQRLDFIVGYRVVMSDNHPAPDICDDLSCKRGDKSSGKGTYPKNFVFKGWHPQCRCYLVPVMKADDELDADIERMLQGELPLPSDDSVNAIDKPNRQFYEYLGENRERIKNASSLPYWYADNIIKVI